MKHGTKTIDITEENIQDGDITSAYNRIESEKGSTHSSVDDDEISSKGFYTDYLNDLSVIPF